MKKLINNNKSNNYIYIKYAISKKYMLNNNI